MGGHCVGAMRVRCWLRGVLSVDGEPYTATVMLGNATDLEEVEGDEYRNYMVLIEEVDDEDVRLYRLSTKSKVGAAAAPQNAGTSYKVWASVCLPG